MKNALASLLKSFQRDESGSTAVEFGFIAAAFMMLLFGIIEAGRLFLTWNTFQFAFENASRAALVDSTITAQEIETMITDQMNDYMVSTTGVSVTVSFTSSSGVQFVDIQGTYDFDSIVPMLPAKWETIELTAHTRQPRQ